MIFRETNLPEDVENQLHLLDGIWRARILTQTQNRHTNRNGTESKVYILADDKYPGETADDESKVLHCLEIDLKEDKMSGDNIQFQCPTLFTTWNLPK